MAFANRNKGPKGKSITDLMREAVRDGIEEWRAVERVHAQMNRKASKKLLRWAYRSAVVETA